MASRNDITALVLAGGRGARMGGLDKGLQTFRSKPLALHALERIRPQVGGVMINANRHLPTYAAFGVPVWPDSMPDYPGPLAGFLTGLTHCDSPYLLTVPCDSPLFPADLAQRLSQAMEHSPADIAMALAPETEGKEVVMRPQPVFCLLRVQLVDSLQAFIRGGGRKIDAWTAQHPSVLVAFDQPGDDPRAFCNTNTLEELHALERA